MFTEALTWLLHKITLISLCQIICEVRMDLFIVQTQSQGIQQETMVEVNKICGLKERKLFLVTFKYKNKSQSLFQNTFSVYPCPVQELCQSFYLRHWQISKTVVCVSAADPWHHQKSFPVHMHNMSCCAACTWRILGIFWGLPSIFTLEHTQICFSVVKILRT